MNMVKLNNKLAAQVISFIEIMQLYQGIEQANSFYLYRKENGAEVIDIDFRLKVNGNGLTVSINKSYDKTLFQTVTIQKIRRQKLTERT